MTSATMIESEAPPVEGDEWWVDNILVEEGLIDPPWLTRLLSDDDDE